jgi:hypothetical protein
LTDKSTPDSTISMPERAGKSRKIETPRRFQRPADAPPADVKKVYPDLIDFHERAWSSEAQRAD